MKKLSRSLLVAASVFLSFSAHAATPISTVNPNVPAQNSPLTSAVLRANFLAAYNDINALWTQATTLFSSTVSGIVPASGGGTTNFLRADGTWATPAGGGGGISALTGDVTATGTGSVAATIASFNTSGSGVYGSASSVPVINFNAKGLATSITPTAIAIGTSQVTGLAATYAPIASPTFTGTLTTPITGSTQCLHVNSAGAISGTGVDCGSGSGSGLPTSTTNNPQILNISALSGTSTASLVNSYQVNPDAALLPHFRQCLANVKTGAGRCRLTVYSDSTAYGYGSQGAGTDVVTYSWLSQLSKSLQSAFGVPSDYDGYLGDSNGQNRLGHDPRISANANWTHPGDGATTGTVGGAMLSNTAASGTYTFTPIKPIDTCKLWYPIATGLGTVTLNFDGGTGTAAPEAGTSAVASTNITASAVGNHAFNVVASGSTTFLIGPECWDSTHPGISVINGGHYGSLSTNNANYGWTYAANAWSPFNAMRVTAGDLTILALDLNDASGATGITAYKANIQSMITQILGGGGDLVIATEGHENNGTGANDATITPYVQAIMQVANAQSPPIPVIENYDRQVSGTNVSNRSWFYSDNIHYNAQGYADITQGVTDFLVKTVGAGSGIGPAFTQSAQAGDVNFLNLFSAATTKTPSLSTYGSDANISLNIAPKGTGGIGIGSASPKSSLDLSQKTDAVALPVGTTGTRPTASEGMIRDNTTLGSLEAYIGGAWQSLVSSTNTTTFAPSFVYNRAPAATDDTNSGYTVGSLWVAQGSVYLANAVTAATASWQKIAPSNTSTCDTVSGAVGCYGVYRLKASYTGAAFELTRASDSTKYAVPFDITGYASFVLADNFCAGTTCGVDDIYDQSGNGYDVVQTTFANMPVYGNATAGKLRGISFGGQPNCSPCTTANVLDHWLANAALPISNRNTFTAYEAYAPINSANLTLQNSDWQLGSPTATFLLYNEETNVTGHGGLLYASPGTGNINIAAPRVSAPQVMTVVNNGGSLTVQQNNVAAPTVATAFSTSASTGFRLGDTNAVASWASYSTFLSFVLYNSAHTAAQQQAVQGTLYRDTGIVPQAKVNLVLFGSSLIGFNGNSTPVDQIFSGQLASAFNDPIRLISYAASGDTLTQLNGYMGNFLAASYVPGMKNIVVLDGASNEYGATTTQTASSVAATVLAGCAIAHTNGFLCFPMSTFPRNGGFSGGQTFAGFEAIRQALITLEKAAFSAGSYDGFIDSGEDPTMGQTSSLTNTSLYFSDQIHIETPVGTNFETNIHVRGLKGYIQ